jgi:selenide,water dikinase
VAQVLRHLPPVNDPNLLVGTQTHDDAGVYRLGPDLAIVQTIDFFPPVVDDPFIYGQIAAANAMSDVYAMGAVPRTALNLVGYPDNKEPLDWLGEILKGGAERAQAAGVVIVGGHTVRDAEIKYGMAVTGTVHPDRIISNSGAQPGDRLVLTKALGTGFITTARKANQCPDDVFEAACAGMIQLNDVARDLVIQYGAHAATDITGFGLAGHGFEMAEGSKVTLAFDLGSLPIIAGAEVLARKPFITRASGTNASYVESALRRDQKLDSTRLEFFYDAQTSGGLLISAPADTAVALVDDAQKRGLTSTTLIGEVLPREGDIALILRP